MTIKQEIEHEQRAIIFFKKYIDRSPMAQISLDRAIGRMYFLERKLILKK